MQRQSVNGRYSIDGVTLLPGTYALDFKRHDATRDNMSWQISPRNVVDAQSSTDSDIQPTSGRSPHITLLSIADGESRRIRQYDAGYFQFARILGGVWNDFNADGYSDPAENAVPSIPIELLDGQGSVFRRTLTNDQGFYEILDIFPGDNFTVRLEPPSGTQLSPYIDRAVVNQNSFAPETFETRPFNIASRQTQLASGGLRGQTDETGIRGVAWDDVNGNGIRDGQESGQDGVLVTVIRDGIEIASTKSDENGVYFLSLVPGVYFLEYDLPQNSTFSPRGQGPDRLRDSDVNRWSGQTKRFSLLSGQIDSSFDVGVYSGPVSGTIAGSFIVTEIGFVGHGNLEFIEVKNITKLPPALAAHSINIAGEVIGDISREEDLVAVDASSTKIIDLRYDDDWFIIMDDELMSWTLTLRDENAPRDLWSNPANWRPSSVLSGSPGRPDPQLTPEPGAVVINEVLAKSVDGFNDLIELRNTTDVDIDIGNWVLADSKGRITAIRDLRNYRIAPGTIIPAGGYLVFSREDNFADPTDQGQNEAFGLSSFGETIHLVAANQFGQIMGYSDSLTFFGTDTGVAYGRVEVSDGSVSSVVMESPTFGRANTKARVGPIVIDQLLYKPAADRDGDEYVRLLNVSDIDVSLDGGDNFWKLDGAVKYNFRRNETIPAGARAFVVPIRPDDFREKYGLPPDILVFGPYDGALDNGGESLELTRPSAPLDDTPLRRDILVDRVNYDNAAPWPPSDPGRPFALVRRSADIIGDEPTNWVATDANPLQYLRRGLILEPQFSASFAAAFYGHDPFGLAVMPANPGDANGDGLFDSSDLVLVLQAGEYDSGRFADWTQGDWNGDGTFDSRDLVTALQRGQFELSARRATLSISQRTVDHVLASWRSSDDEPL